MSDDEPTPDPDKTYIVEADHQVPYRARMLDGAWVQESSGHPVPYEVTRWMEAPEVINPATIKRG